MTQPSLTASAPAPPVSQGSIAPGVRLRLGPEDEGMHPLGPELNFNESMYINFFDAGSGLGGFFRLGNRANEGHAELTVCLYQPDGSVAFAFARPAITGNDAFDAGGLSFTVTEPFQSLTVRFAGEALHLHDPLDMADPKAAYADNPRVHVSAELHYRGCSPMLGGEPVAEEGVTALPAHDGDFAVGHYEQHVVASGHVTVGDHAYAVSEGVGLRDHSWGPRHWQSPWWYRWLTGNLGPHAGFVASVIARRDGSRVIGGVVFRDGDYEQITDVTLRTDWADAPGVPGGVVQQTIVVDLVTTRQSYAVRGSVDVVVPLRHRRTDDQGAPLLTRITEGMTRWSCPALSPVLGSGLSEYLDQVIDGEPVGRREEAAR